PGTGSSTGPRSASTWPTASRAAARRSRSMRSARARGRRGCAPRSPSDSPLALVVVDAENARRSLWPNLSPEDLVAPARRWAAREGHELRVVSDGDPPEDADDLTASAYADDVIAALVERADGPVWVVSSDRELRRRVEVRADRVIGGGSFVRSI